MGFGGFRGFIGCLNRVFRGCIGWFLSKKIRDILDDDSVKPGLQKCPKKLKKKPKKPFLIQKNFEKFQNRLKKPS